MASIDLGELSLEELKQLKKDVAKAITSFEERRKVEARAKVEAVAKEMGFTISELVGLEGKRLRAAAAPKYQHPENPAVTWSGRGRQPKWFVDALEAGKKPEDMAVS